jgi:uncharacterized protein (DUF488 family)
MTISILTIGYGNLAISKFITNLQSNNVQAVIDIRSKPYSRYRPQYNRKNLEENLLANGIGYKFQGDKLGGLPSNPDLHTDNFPDYNKIRKTLSYQYGLDYLEKGLEFDYTMVLLCACSDYSKCHRYNLVGLDLERLGYEVLHILKDGSKTQERRLF